jgi:hypothetical protein
MAFWLTGGEELRVEASNQKLSWLAKAASKDLEAISVPGNNTTAAEGRLRSFGKLILMRGRCRSA